MVTCYHKISSRQTFKTWLLHALAIKPKCFPHYFKTRGCTGETEDIVHKFIAKCQTSKVIRRTYSVLGLGTFFLYQLLPLHGISLWLC